MTLMTLLPFLTAIVLSYSRARRGTRTPTVLPTSTSSLFFPTTSRPNLFPGAAIPRFCRWVGRGKRCAVLAVALCPACLVTTYEGTPLQQGQMYTCTYQLHHQQLVGRQCGPVGDPVWVIRHFDFESDFGVSAVCSATASPCVYDPDHQGWMPDAGPQ